MRHFRGVPTNAVCRLRATGAVLVAGLVGLVAFAGGATATPPDNALQFNEPSGSQYVRFGAVGATTDALNAAQFTLEVWFRRTGAGTPTSTSAAGGNGLSSAVALLAKGRGEGDYSNLDMNYFLGIDTTTNKLAADFEDSAAVSPNPNNHAIFGSTTIPANDNTWRHAAATYDGVTFRLYLDGRLEAKAAVGVPPRSDSIQRTALGAALTSTGAAAGFFRGQLDEPRIWNVARTGAQLRAHKDVEITAPQPNLIGRWGLDEGVGGAGTTVADSSASNVSGTLVGPPVWVAGYAFPIDSTAPAAPQNLQAEDGNARVTLYWSPNSESDVVGYNVFRSTTSPVDTSGTPLNGTDLVPSAGFTDASAANGTLYYYTVIAVDRANNLSPAATEVTGTASASAGSSLSFNRVRPDQYVTFGAAPGLNAAQFTLETWFIRTGTGVGTSTGGGGIANAVPLITKGRAEAETPLNLNMNYFLGIDATTGRLVADFEDSANGANHPVTGVATVTSGVWHHVAATYGAGAWNLYLDGQLDVNLPVGAFTPEPGSTQHAALATAMTSGGVADGFFDGILDEVRIWNVVRDQAQIQAAMNTEITAPTANLIGRWGMNEGSGTTVLTSSGSTNGSAVGNPIWATGRSFAPPPPGDPVFVGAGDIAGEGWTTDSDTAALISGITGQVFTIGDNAYPDGTTSEFNLWYDPTWGAFLARTRPAPGNHDYNTSNATGYFGYFGSAAGNPSLGYYSYDISGNGVTWHIVVLNSECESPGGLWLAGGCASGSTQEQWLRNDLAAATTNNIIAIWHKPRWSSTANHPHMQALWQALYDYGVDIALGGHWHNYERFMPIDASGNHDPTFGIRAFTVGTGGANLTGFNTILSTSEVRNSVTYGVIKFTLHASSYDWQFIPIPSQTFGDSGTQAVHGAPPPPTGGPALRFNGSSQYVRVGTPVPSPGNTDGLNASAFTLETWFRRTGTGTGTSTGSGGIGSALPLIAKGRAESGSEGTNRDMNYFLGIDTATNTLAADFEDSATGLNHPVYGTTAIDPDGTWHHAAASFDGTHWRLYLDGRLETKLSVAGFSPRSDSIARTAFASALDSTGADAGYFGGDLDEIRIWGVARSGSQVRSAKDDEITGSDTGLLGRWGLAETSGSTAADTSGNGNTGSLQNNPTWVAGHGFPQDTRSPGAASGLAATPGDASVGLSWTASPSSDVAGYNVYRSTSPGVVTTGTPVNGTDLVSGTSFTDTGLTNSTTYYYRVVAVDTADNASADSDEASATPVVGDPVFVGAGDIADCDRPQDSDTATLVAAIPGQVFTLGDNVYPNGTATEFATCYEQTWGAFKARTRPTIGNHDFGNGSTPGATPYFNYFGASAGDPALGYYSYDITGNGVTWHVVSLNSECEPSTGYWLPGGCAAGSVQEQWLRNDLANASTNNIIALMHKPRWSSTSNHAHMQALWKALYDGGVDIALAGHWHNYESFMPMDADGNADASLGVRAFTVGTGGASLAGFGTILPTSLVRNSTTYGVIKFTLHASSYDWQFIPISTQTFTDSGTGTVHDAQSGTVSAGGSVTTDNEGDGATAADPVETTVEHPAGGDISIREGAPASGSFFGQRVQITVTPPGTVANPLQLTFLLDPSIIPSGQSAATIKVYKNGVEVPGCTGPSGQAAPDPCVSARQTVAGGDASITVLSSDASNWDFGSGTPTAVRLVRFRATRTASGAVLRWRTASETRLAGFAVYGLRGGVYQRLSRKLIPAAGGPGGHAYTWRHRLTRGAVVSRYRLQAVNLDGTRNWLGTVRVARG